MKKKRKKIFTPFNDTIIFGSLKEIFLKCFFYLIQDNNENEVIPETQEIITNGGGGKVHESVINEALPAVDSDLL
jgi:hypothetical protein